MKLPKCLRLPSPKELGKCDYNALPSRMFQPFNESYCWEDYYKEMKQHYPVKYFFRELGKFNRKIISKIKRLFSQPKYWIKSYIIRQDHKLDLRQSNGYDNYSWGYIDPCQKILYACFNALKYYIEEEKIKDHWRGMYSMTEEDVLKRPELRSQFDTFQEAKLLHKYWTEDRNRISKEIRELLNKAQIAVKNNNKEEYDFYHKQWLEDYNNFDEQEEEMLRRLIKIRRTFWT